jgi:hypothetical protein
MVGSFRIARHTPTIAKAGDTARAKRAFQGFSELWKDADPDIPFLKQTSQRRVCKVEMMAALERPTTIVFCWRSYKFNWFVSG